MQMAKPDIEQVIRAAVKAKVQEALEAETKAACERLGKALAEEVDRIALSVMSHYHIRQREHEIVITVTKPTDEVNDAE